MLNRRKFLQAAGITVAGAAVSMTKPIDLFAQRIASPHNAPELPTMQYSGHKRSGCASRPELADIWHGGGWELPDNL